MSSTSSNTIKILIVEDNPDDVLLLREMLAESRTALFELAHVERLDQAFEYLAAQEVDVVLLDLSLTDSQGLDSFTRLASREPRVPIILLTGLDDEELAVKAVREGAQDYLVKGRMDRNPLARSIRYAIERKRAEEDVRLRSRELEALFAIASIISQPGSFEEKATRVMEELAHVVEGDSMVLRMPDEDSQNLRSAAAKGPGAQGILQSRGTGISTLAFQRGEPVILNDYSPDPNDANEVVYQNVRSAVSLPIKAGDRPLAVITIMSTQVDHFTPERVKLLRAIGDGLGVLLENTRLNEEITLNQELERRRNEFISVASHELRTPMTIIMGFSELLLRADPPAAVGRQWLERINQDSRKLSAIVDDLLNVSRIQSGTLTVNLELLPLCEAINEALEDITLTTDKHQFSVDIPPETPQVVADPDKLAQVLRNLLDNAVKYSPEGGRVEISAAYRPELARVVVSVTDQGIGITEPDQRSLYTTFQRIHRPETAGISGTGLGLYIVKELVHLMSGEVSMESRLNEGSRFSFSLATQRAET